MQFTVIADDSHVYIEGHALTTDISGLHDLDFTGLGIAEADLPRLGDLSELGEDIHAAHWYGTVGEIEFRYNQIAHSKRHNVRFTNPAPFQPFIDRWMEEAQKEDTPAPTDSGQVHVIE